VNIESQVDPVIIIRQYPDYPNLGESSKFPGGLVAVLWPDGRMIRATSRDAVGEAYIEGYVSEADCEEFLAFLDTSDVFKTQGPGIPLHVAFQQIKVCRDGRILECSRLLPDLGSALDGVEQHLLAVPLQNIRSVEWQIIKESKWYE